MSYFKMTRFDTRWQLVPEKELNSTSTVLRLLATFWGFIDKIFGANNIHPALTTNIGESIVVYGNSSDDRKEKYHRSKKMIQLPPVLFENI